MELTPAQQHVQRVLAEQSRPTVTESSNGTLLMQLIGDRQEIGSVQSFEARAELKREKLPHYAGFIEGVLANQVGLSEDDTTLLQELFVWTVDTFELSQVRQLYAWMSRPAGSRELKHANRRNLPDSRIVATRRVA